METINNNLLKSRLLNHISSDSIQVSCKEMDRFIQNTVKNTKSQSLYHIMTDFSILILTKNSMSIVTPENLVAGYLQFYEATKDQEIAQAIVEKAVIGAMNNGKTTDH